MLLQTLILIFVIVAIAWAAFWIIDRAGTPHPFNMILKLFVGAVALIALLQRTGLLAGTGLG
jgi:hypothetical protein